MISYAALVENLICSNRYPVLVFLFSRKLVEEKALETAKTLNLLAGGAAQIIEERIRDSLQGAAGGLHGTLFECIRRGVGYHHAGVVPSARRLVEQLFVDGLLPVVFCTETFAMGVNYPARAVVIGQNTKRDDHGFRPLTSREILQMAGRAGRRGQDRRGYVYFCVDPYYPGEAPARAPVKPEPVLPANGLEPENVLRIVVGLGPDRAVLEKYVTKSFRSFAAAKLKQQAFDSWQAAAEQLRLETERAGCADFARCLEQWERWKRCRQDVARLESELSAARKRRKKLKKKGKSVSEVEKRVAALYEQIAAAKQEMDAALAEAATCPRGGPALCSLFDGLKKKRNRCADLHERYKRLPDARTAGWGPFAAIAEGLASAGFLTSEWGPTAKGMLALDASAGGVMLAEVLTRVLESGAAALSPALVAGLSAGCLCESRELRCGNSDIHRHVAEAYRHLKKNGIKKFYNEMLERAVSMWADGAGIKNCAERMGAGPGDFVILARRTAEVLRGLVQSSACPEFLREAAGEAHRAVWRGEVADVF